MRPLPATTALVLTALLGAAAGVAPPAAAAAPTCQGLRATIVGDPGGEVIDGTRRRDVIVGLGGDDVIRGRGGDDVICGGPGRDLLHGGPGDDTFSGDPNRAITICHEMQDRGIRTPWTSNMRAQDARPPVLEAMRDAGAYRVFIGFESIQKATLQLVKKGATPERMIEKAQLVKDAGLELHASFIVGAPGDTDETLAATLDYIRLLDPTVATFNVMEPRPGTDVYANPDRYGIQIPDPYWYESTGWLDLPVCRNEHLSQEQIRDWIERCYAEFCSPHFRSPEVLAGLGDIQDQWRTAGLPAAGVP